MWKVQPLIDLLQHTCGEMYNSGQQFSIDESLIGTKCRLSFIQYFSAKHTKWGVKVWVCCDAAIGYILSFNIYTGKYPNVSILLKSLAFDVILRLLENRFNKSYSVCRQLLHRPKLVFILVQKGVAATGTRRTNRKNIPSELKDWG